MLTSLAVLATGLALATAGDINRQSIIFNENTPDVFYCPQVGLDPSTVTYTHALALVTSAVIFIEIETLKRFKLQEKPISIDRMLVKSKPMKKLCEYEGRGLPENVKSDCWNDVDETEYACSVSSAEIGSSQK